MIQGEWRHGNAAVLTVKGRVDLTNSDAFSDTINATIDALPEPPMIVLDCAGLTYINSTGLRVIMVVAKRIRSAKGRTFVSGLTTTVREIFDIAGYAFIVEMMGTVGDALSAAAPDAAAAYGAAHR